MLIALLVAAAGVSPPLPKQFGYPVFVRAEGEQCTYQIQDMGMRDQDMVRRWMEKYPFKSLRVDIVIIDRVPKECVETVEATLKDIGYSDVIIRNGSVDDYGDVGPSR